MYSTIAVLASNAVNRDNVLITTGALHDTVYENALLGTPALLNHDSLKPIGWNFPFALYFEPGLARLVGNYQVAETTDDQKIISSAYLQRLTDRHSEECAPHREELNKLLDGKISSDAVYVNIGCASCVDEGVLHRVYPHITEKCDKDGLIYLNDLLSEFDYLGQGIFKDKKKNVAVFCHQFFRRSLSILNTVNTEFLDQFLELRNEPGITLRIALDANRIGLASSFHQTLEFEYIFGPKYSDDVSNIRAGVCELLCDEVQRLISAVSGMHFWWKDDSKEKILEAEELRDTPTAGVKGHNYGCRYVHSIYDTSQNRFNHFDGAIRTYSSDEMIQRLDKPINKAGKHAHYTKLFRIDGDLKLANWKTLVTFYFQGNPLVYEYFGVKEDHDTLYQIDNTKELNSTPQKEFIPYHMNDKEGVRVLLSYHRPSKVNQSYERAVINTANIEYAGSITPVVEFTALEIQKSLSRIGQELVMPQDVRFVNFLDKNINFPTILHRNADQVHSTIEAYIKVLEKLKRTSIVTLSLAWPTEEKEVRISVMGTSTQVIIWLKDQHHVPQTCQDFRNWAERLHSSLTQNYPPAFNNPRLKNLVNTNGTLEIKRRFIPREWTDISQIDSIPALKLRIPEAESKLKHEIDGGTMYPCACYIVDVAKCSLTGENYLTSTSSKLLDNNVKPLIEKGSLIGVVLTTQYIPLGNV